MAKALKSTASLRRSEGFELRQRESGGVVILDLKGDFVRTQARDQVDALVRHLVYDGKTRLVLNLRDAGPLDEDALCALLVDLVRVRNGGGDLRLLYVQPPNMDFLLRTKTDRAFRIFSSEQDAVAGF